MLSVIILCLVASTSAVPSSETCISEQDYYPMLQVPSHDCGCNKKSEGTLRYHDNVIQFCNGEEYVELGGGGGNKLGSKGKPAKSCSKILEENSEAKSGMYYLKKGDSVSKTYCYMETICGSKGWTLLMKIDGAKTTFLYNSKYWANKETYEVDNAAGLDNRETKLRTYSEFPFNRLCLGLKTKGETNWININYKADSLYSLIADGKYRSTNVGRSAWKSLIKGSSLQPHCNREGFNVLNMARIGIVSNQENNCASPDSRLGFGTGGNRCGEDGKNSAGNEARCGSDNGDKSIKSFGYIFAKEEQGEAPLGSSENPASSCNEIIKAESEAKSGMYYLKKGDSVSKTYCYMETICGSKGWTLLMKIDGNKKTFDYNSKYWVTQETYNEGAAVKGLNSNEETKVSAYSTHPFTKLCLGMKVGSGTPHWITVPKQAKSLYEVIHGDKFQATSVGRGSWKSLVAGSSLQRNCNREGFNVDLNSVKVRIGIIGNNENNCLTADSYLGFGVTNKGFCGLKIYSAGNGAGCGGDNGNKNVPVMGFILAN